MLKRLVDLAKTYDNPQLWIKNIAWRFPSTISDLQAVFVVGAPRSGTTLLQRSLSVHSHLFTIQGETGLFSYQNIFDEKRKHFGLCDAEIERLIKESTDVVDFFSRGVNLLATKNGGKRFIEKTPQHILKIPYIHRHFPNSLIIHIVRDGRDCYCSSKTHPWIPQNKSAASFAKYWKKCVSVPMSCTVNGSVLTVKYEDFVCEPIACLAEIMGFIGLEVENIQLDPDRVGDDKRANLQEFCQLKKPINSSSVGRWVSELSDVEIYEIEKIAGNELEHYDYKLKDSSSLSS